MVIPKPQRLVSGHRIDNHLTETGSPGTLEPSEQLTKRVEAVLFKNSAQAAFHQILLVISQQNAARILQECFELFVFLGRYIRFHWISIVGRSLNRGINRSEERRVGKECR